MILVCITRGLISLPNRCRTIIWRKNLRTKYTDLLMKCDHTPMVDAAAVAHVWLFAMAGVFFLCLRDNENLFNTSF